MFSLRRISEVEVDEVREFAPGPGRAALIGKWAEVRGPGFQNFVDCEALKASYHFNRFFFVGPNEICVTDLDGNLLMKYRSDHQIATDSNLVHVSKMVAPTSFDENVLRRVVVASLVPHDKLHVFMIDLDRKDITEVRERSVEELGIPDAKRVFYSFTNDSVVALREGEIYYIRDGRGKLTIKRGFFKRKAKIVDADLKAYPAIGDVLALLLEAERALVEVRTGEEFQQVMDVPCGNPKGLALAWSSLLLLCEEAAKLWVLYNEPNEVFRVEGSFRAVRVEEPYMGLLGESLWLFEVEPRFGLEFFESMSTLFRRVGEV